MYEWNYAVQEMIDWIDEHCQSNLTLDELARQIGYS